LNSGRRGTLVVLAKAPRVGRVKTRLIPPFTAAQAADFYTAMLSDVLDATAEFAESLELAAVVAVHPGASCTAVARVAPAIFRVVPQRGADLGARMSWAVREAAAAGASRVLLRGSDSPTLGASAVHAALTALEEFDVVLGPDRDGGYSLVGVRKPNPGLFQHAMSTPLVLQNTLANAARLGLRTRLAESSFDIDLAEDLQLLASACAAGAAVLCPRTAAYLDANDLWPASHPPGG
jgi:rSAM/selenodomain-associated transferase 1